MRFGKEYYRSKVHFHHIVFGNACDQQIIGMLTLITWPRRRAMFLYCQVTIFTFPCSSVEESLSPAYTQGEENEALPPRGTGYTFVIWNFSLRKSCLLNQFPINSFKIYYEYGIGK